MARLWAMRKGSWHDLGYQERGVVPPCSCPRWHTGSTPRCPGLGEGRRRRDRSTPVGRTRARHQEDDWLERLLMKAEGIGRRMGGVRVKARFLYFTGVGGLWPVYVTCVHMGMEQSVPDHPVTPRGRWGWAMERTDRVWMQWQSSLPTHSPPFWQPTASPLA